MSHQPLAVAPAVVGDAAEDVRCGRRVPAGRIRPLGRGGGRVSRHLPPVAPVASPAVVDDAEDLPAAGVIAAGTFRPLELARRTGEKTT